MRNHLKTRWHYHTAVWFTILAALIAFAGTSATVHYIHRGGLTVAPLPPPIHISGGRVPLYASLTPFIVRIHDQGLASSCVGQTLATIEEITYREAHPHQHPGFSSGFIWNQLNGGYDQGLTYDAAFGLLQREGDAQLHVFPHDGQASDRWAQPDSAVLSEARQYTTTSWHSISPYDIHTIEYEVFQGRPVAVALPIYQSFFQAFGLSQLPTISSQYGPFEFWHSMTIVGYNQVGPLILNSWGSRFGSNGLWRATWSMLPAYSAGLVVSVPHHYYQPPVRRHTHARHLPARRKRLPHQSPRRSLRHPAKPHGAAVVRRRSH